MLKRRKNIRTGSQQAGFTLLESLIAMVVLLAVGAIILYGTIHMTNAMGTVSNRTEMHTSVRSATELLQQEIGQAGRIAPPLNSTGTAPADLSLSLPVAVVGVATALPISPSSVVGQLFNGENLAILDTSWDSAGNPKTETVQVICSNPCVAPTAIFANTHAAQVPISVQGAFADGIVPPSSVTGLLNGSDDTHLKLFGDINGDGTMVYVEYDCQPTNSPTAPGFLYRTQVAWNLTSKPAVSSDNIMLNNLLTNPVDQNGNPFPCFQYQTQTIGTCPGLWPACRAYVTDVEVTLTEQTEYRDPTSKQFQRETKALLNVSPRNVFNAWQLDGAKQLNRVQPRPPTITSLLQ